MRSSARWRSRDASRRWSVAASRDRDEEAEWTELVGELWALRSAPEGWVDVYTRWLEGGSERTRSVALAGLLDPKAGFQPLPAESMMRTRYRPTRPN